MSVAGAKRPLPFERPPTGPADCPGSVGGGPNFTLLVHVQLALPGPGQRGFDDPGSKHQPNVIFTRFIQSDCHPQVFDDATEAEGAANDPYRQLLGLAFGFRLTRLFNAGQGCSSGGSAAFKAFLSQMKDERFRRCDPTFSTAFTDSDHSAKDRIVRQLLAAIARATAWIAAHTFLELRRAGRLAICQLLGRRAFSHRLDSR